MDPLRTHLHSLSPPSLSPLPSQPTSCLSPLSSSVISLVHSSPPSLHLYSLPPLPPSSASLSLPSAFSHPSSYVLPATSIFALCSPTLILLSPLPTPPSLSLREPRVLFSPSTSVSILHVAWHPIAPAFLLVLTSDSTLRLFDALAPRSPQRLVLPVVSPAPAVSFTFSRGPLWHALAVYVLTEDGAIYVAAPIAPVGTRLSPTLWQNLSDTTDAAIRREFHHQNHLSNKHPDHQLDNSLESWTARQARLRRMFLDVVFAPAADGQEMVAVREFKPAPLLFQGPLYVEHEHVVENNNTAYEGIRMIKCGDNIPGVLLHWNTNGQMSVLVGIEQVEAQWFVGSEDDYTQSAQAVAPALLCFEHMRFDEPIQVATIGSDTDADILWVSTSTEVYAVHLSFIAAMADPATLESMPKSTIREVLSVWGADRADHVRIAGMAPWYSKGEGAVAVVYTTDGTLELSSPLRWTTGLELMWPGKLLGDGLGAEGAWSIERPKTGSRAYACAEPGKETVKLLIGMRALVNEIGSRLGGGVLGKVRDLKEVGKVVDLMEKRLDIVIGGGSGNITGIADSFKSLVVALDDWCAELREKSSTDTEAMDRMGMLAHDLEKVQVDNQRKFSKVQKSNMELQQRLQGILKKIQMSSSELSEAEAERHRRLRERRRQLRTLANRILDVERSVHMPRTSQYAPESLDSQRPLSRKSPSSRSPFARSKVVSPNPSWRGQVSPFGNRRDQGVQKLDLTRQELQKIRKTLLQHSEDIGFATELSTKLWEQLATT